MSAFLLLVIHFMHISIQLLLAVYNKKGTMHSQPVIIAKCIMEYWFEFKLFCYF